MIRKIAKLIGPKKFEFFEEEIPELLDDEILIKMISVGLCHSDIPAYFGTSCMGKSKNGYGAISDNIEYPLGLGHEPVGIVEKIGKNVTRFKVGDLVTGTGAGCFSTHVIVNQNKKWVVIPTTIKPVDCCLGEPMMCVANIVQAANPKLGDKVAVIGCGFMGLMCIAGMKSQNLGDIVAIDFIEDKLKLAMKYGATKTINPANIDLEDEMFKITEGKGFDIVIEITGSLKGLDSALSIVKIAGKGKILAPSMYTKGETFTEKMAYNMMYRSPIIHVVHPWYSDDYMDTLNKAVNAYISGLFPTDELVTHRIPFDNIAEAFELLEKNPSGYIKGIVTF